MGKIADALASLFGISPGQIAMPPKNPDGRLQRDVRTTRVGRDLRSDGVVGDSNKFWELSSELRLERSKTMSVTAWR